MCDWIYPFTCQMSAFSGLSRNKTRLFRRSCLKVSYTRSLPAIVLKEFSSKLFRIFFPVFWIEQLQLTASEPCFSCCIENPSPTKILTINPCLVLIQMQKYRLFSKQPLEYWKLTLRKYPKNGRDKFKLYASSFSAIYFLHGCTVGIFIREKLQAKLTLERTLFWIFERVLMGNVCARF